MFISLVLALAPAAPIPAPPRTTRPITRGEVIGTWTFAYPRASRVRFNADGSMQCTYAGVSYEGHWRFSDGKVLVQERRTDLPLSSYTPYTYGPFLRDGGTLYAEWNPTSARYTLRKEIAHPHPVVILPSRELR